MAKRTVEELANLIEDMVDKDRNDTTFDAYVQQMLYLTFQEIASEVPHARWLLDEDSVTTTSGQQYVSLPSDMDIDALKSARVENDIRKVRRIDPADADEIDPGRDLTGEEILYWFQRVGGSDRLYFLHQPDSTDTVTFMFGNIVDDPASGSSFPLPAKYESTLIHGALIKVWSRLDPDYNVITHEKWYTIGLNRIKRDANSFPGGIESLSSHRPRTATGISGASFPGNFDVRP